MRHKRAKAYKRLMAIYIQTFNFRAPFQVLVSNDLLTTTAAQQLDIKKGLATCVQGEIKPMITQCCMEALYAGGKDVQQVTNLAKSFERRRCNHRTAIPPDECLTDVVGATNKHRYVLATQSPTLLTSLSSIPGLPIVHFNPRGVLVLSPPSTATIRAKNTAEEGRRLEGAKTLEELDEGDNVVGASTAGSVGGGGSGGRGAASSTSAGGAIPLDALPAGLGLGKRKVKGPNPLSVKKRKTAGPSGANDVVVDKGKRKRVNGVGNAAAEEAADADVDMDETQAGVVTGGQGHERAQVADGRKSKKKRKRSKKSEVAKAISELNATNVGEGGDESD